MKCKGVIFCGSTACKRTLPRNHITPNSQLGKNKNPDWFLFPLYLKSLALQTQINKLKIALFENAKRDYYERNKIIISPNISVPRDVL